MKVKLRGITDKLNQLDDALRFSQCAGRVCKTEKDWEDLEKEPFKQELIDRFLNSGHHSVFGHLFMNYYLDGIPKALAMVLNNERQYTTSEKSARFTQMADVEPEQRELYEKWMKKLELLVDKTIPKKNDSGWRKKLVRERCQENARYMTSTFTPTKMLHTISLRQLNFLMEEFEKFSTRHGTNNYDFHGRLAQAMKEFNEQADASRFFVSGLENQTDRHLSFFGPQVEEHFGDVYSTSYLMSFAGLAQAQRHRTLGYQVSEGTDFGASLGFFIPEVIKENPYLSEEWLDDLGNVAKSDFPQGQLIRVNETGTLKDFRSKMILRLCGHAQYEIMKQTLKTAQKYADAKPEIAEWVQPKCLQGFVCEDGCAWGGKAALERIV